MQTPIIPPCNVFVFGKFKDNLFIKNKQTGGKEKHTRGDRERNSGGGGAQVVGGMEKCTIFEAKISDNGRKTQTTSALEF